MPQILDDEDWSSIHFEGHPLPPSVMGIAVLISEDTLSDSTGEWLWRLTICCGVLKTGASAWCHESAVEVIDYLLEKRAEVLEIVVSRLQPHGFDPELTYAEWISGLSKIRDVSKAMNGECSWIADMPNFDRDGVERAG